MNTSDKKIHVLFADDEVLSPDDQGESLIDVFKEEVPEFNFIPQPTLTTKAILESLEQHPEITVVILDLLRGKKRVGDDILKAIPKNRVQVIVYSHITDDSKLVNECDAEGAYDYLKKGQITYDKIRTQIQYAHDHALACREFWESDLKEFPIPYKIYGRSDKIRHVIDRIHQLAKYAVNVLITGETGVGKELVAHGIHQKSGLKPNAFFSQNIAAISKDLLQSELFGHTADAFTGATRSRNGLFVETGWNKKTRKQKRGTVFLDEIGDTPREIQVALLRVVQEHKVKPVGSDVVFPPGDSELGFRLICATNTDLDKRIKEGEFRSDLYYRIAEEVINVPSLRERPQDIGILTHQFFAIHRRTLMKSETEVTRIDPEDLEMMKRYHWPGNVRELDSIVKRSLIRNESKDEIFRLSEDDRAKMQAALDSDFSMEKKEATWEEGSKEETAIYFPQPMTEIQRQAVRLAFEHMNGNITQAAKLLGMNRPVYRRWMEKYGIMFQPNI